MCNKLSDDELIKKHRGGDIEAFNAIYLRYKNMIKGIVRSYFLVGGDSDDVLQEGLLGLLKAVNTYNSDYSGASSFKTFAYLCVSSNIKTAIKKAYSYKNKPLNYYVSMSPEDESKLRFCDPEQEIINIESESELKKKVTTELSNFELEVLKMFLGGSSYSEIAAKFSKKEKAIDNALQRIRKKLNGVRS